MKLAIQAPQSVRPSSCALSSPWERGIAHVQFLLVASVLAAIAFGVLYYVALTRVNSEFDTVARTAILTTLKQSPWMFDAGDGFQEDNGFGDGLAQKINDALVTLSVQSGVNLQNIRVEIYKADSRSAANSGATVTEADLYTQSVGAYTIMSNAAATFTRIGVASGGAIAGGSALAQSILSSAVPSARNFFVIAVKCDAPMILGLVTSEVEAAIPVDSSSVAGNVEFSTYNYTPIGSPSVSPTPTPSATPTSTPTGTPTTTPSATPTDSPTATPSATPSATPTDSPTATPTDTPTATPTDSPTATPTGSPEPTPTLG